METSRRPSEIISRFAITRLPFLDRHWAISHHVIPCYLPAIRARDFVFSIASQNESFARDHF